LSAAILAITLTDTEAKIAAIITGFGGVMAAVGGVYLTLHTIRSKEHKASKESLDQAESYLAEERKHRIEAERQLFEANLLLSKNGIDPPKAPDEISP
jgi:hypothetical protein